MNLSSNGSQRKDLNEFMGVCDSINHLAISIFKIDTKNFVYYSESVDDILGYCPDRLKTGGWELWYSFLNASERPVIEHKISEFLTAESFRKKRRRMILRYHLKSARKKKLSLKHEIRLKKIANQVLAVSYIFDRSDKEIIENYLASGKKEKGATVSLNPKAVVSDREKQVLKLIGCGLSSKQIADKLYISVHTAISHRKNLIKKFEVKNSAELIKEASKVFNL